MEINNPEVLAEVQAAFARYEAALTSNNLDILDASFWEDPRTIRYGVGENLHGVAEIRDFRTARLATGLMRHIEHTVITTFGHDFATASTLFRRDAMVNKIGRQMQTWVRLPQGWRVVAATVSIIPEHP